MENVEQGKPPSPFEKMEISIDGKVCLARGQISEFAKLAVSHFVENLSTEEHLAKSTISTSALRMVYAVSVGSMERLRNEMEKSFSEFHNGKMAENQKEHIRVTAQIHENYRKEIEALAAEIKELKKKKK